MKTIKIFIIIISILTGINAYSQDPSFSQFYNNQTYYNPAFVGIHGGMMANLTYRRQWVKIPGKFETEYFNFDSDLSCINGLGGIGISAFRDVEGMGYLNNTGASFMLSIRKFLKENSFIQFGTNISIIQQTADFSNFIFSDQYDAINGYTPNTEFKYLTDKNTIFPDISFGLVFKGGDGPRKGIFNSNYDYKLGASINHLVSQNNSFLGKESKIPTKIVLSGNMNIATNRDASNLISPGIVYEFNLDYPQGNLLIGFNYTLNESFFIGGWGHIGDISTVSFVAGFNSKFFVHNKSTFDLMKFYYCYDITVSGIDNTSTGGSHEIGISYFFNKSLCKLMGWRSNKYNYGTKYKKRRRIPCNEPNNGYGF
jgi:type IX secretion system PorP/SprF family membrane protein